jgi:hypothetical protein
MTIKETLRTLGTLGLKARWSPEWREYRVTLPDPSPEREEAMAYYTDDPEDAIGTGIAMLETANMA